jgi:hypothetical protein
VRATKEQAERAAGIKNLRLSRLRISLVLFGTAIMPKEESEEESDFLLTSAREMSVSYASGTRE